MDWAAPPGRHHDHDPWGNLQEGGATTKTRDHTGALWETQETALVAGEWGRELGEIREEREEIGGMVGNCQGKDHKDTELSDGGSGYE